jgi:hypothetical protein
LRQVKHLEYDHDLRGDAGFGLVPDLKADSPAAAWYAFYLFHKKFSLCANFL